MQRPNFPQLRELAGAGDFEGYVSFGLGLTHRTGFRAVPLSGPDRLVLDLQIPATPTRSAAPRTAPAGSGSTTGAPPAGPPAGATEPRAAPAAPASAPQPSTPASPPSTWIRAGAIVAAAAAALLLAGTAGLRLTRRR